MHLSPVEFIFSLKWGRKKKRGGRETLGWPSVKWMRVLFPPCFSAGSQVADHERVRGWIQPLKHMGGLWETGVWWSLYIGALIFQSLVISAGMVWGVSAPPLCWSMVHERRQICPSPAVANGRPLIKWIKLNAFSSSSLRTPPQSPLKYWVLGAALGRSVLTHQVVDKPQITELKKLVQKQTYRM